MEAEKGKRVKIRYKCKLRDGKNVRIDDSDTLDVVIGDGSIPPALETTLLGMQPGEHRAVTVTAAEVSTFPAFKGAQLVVEKEVPTAIAYEFGPGEGGDVSLSVPAKPLREPVPVGADLLFDMVVLSIEEQGRK